MTTGLGGRVQADFSGTFVKENGPLVMGLSYLKHLAFSHPFKAIERAASMSFRYAQYLYRLRFAEENLEDVFSLFEGMPASLVEEVADTITLNPAFIQAVDKYREEQGLDYCLLDILTRDASCLVERFIESHADDIEAAGIRIGTVKANHLEEREGVLTGECVVQVTLQNKLDYINPELPYFVSDQEYGLYHELLPDIRRINSNS